MTIFDERIEKLRAIMAENGIDYYLIPTADDHASEYVGGYYKLRLFFAGFTGSAGTLLIGQKMAGLWTDGRYFIQAENELKDSCVTLFRMGQEDVPDIITFIEENIPEGGVLAYDGRMVDSAWGSSVQAKLGKKNAKIFRQEDLAGDLWEERPELISEPVFELDTCYSGKPRSEKLKNLRKMTRAAGCQFTLISSLDDIAWLLNLRGNDISHTPVFLSFLLVGEKEASLYCFKDAFKESIQSQLAGDNICIKPYSQVYDDVSRLSDVHLMLDKKRTNDALWNCIGKEVRTVCKDVTQFVPRAVKNNIEIENLKRVHEKDGAAVAKFMYWLKNHIGREEITEISASDYLESLRKQIDTYLDLSFDTISAYNANAAMMHYCAGEDSCAVLKPEGMLLVDSGGQYYEGTTDITRTFVLGHITDEMKKHFTLTVKSMLNLASARFLYGCTGHTLDILARGPLWDIGIDYQCGTGHGVGYLLGVHEPPNGFRWKSVPERDDVAVLEAGMVTTDEPGVYIGGSHGIRIENELLCCKGEKNEYGQFMYFEPLTWAPIDLDGIDTKWLSREDILRLDSYHEQVYKHISPYLDGEEKQWLKNATRPLFADII